MRNRVDRRRSRHNTRLDVGLAGANPGTIRNIYMHTILYRSRLCRLLRRNDGYLCGMLEFGRKETHSLSLWVLFFVVCWELFPSSVLSVFSEDGPLLSSLLPPLRLILLPVSDEKAGASNGFSPAAHRRIGPSHDPKDFGLEADRCYG